MVEQKRQTAFEVLDIDVVHKAIILGDSPKRKEAERAIFIGKNGLEAAAQLAMNTGRAYGLVPYRELAIRVKKDGQESLHRSKPPVVDNNGGTEAGIVYINGKILSPDTVRAIHKRSISTDPKIEQYVITTWGGIRPYRQGLDKVVQTSKS